MRLSCPQCGTRDLREFTYKGDAVALARPVSPEWSEDWDNYLHLRDNPAGVTGDLWQHSAGCSAWLVVKRDTVTHAVHSVALVERGLVDAG